MAGTTITMPQVRYYHHGRYYRPARSMPLLPPLSLVPAVDTSSHHKLNLGCHDEDEAIARRWRTTREKEFRWMIRYIGESLTGENIADMRFLCRDHVQPPDVLRQAMKGGRLMSILERHRLLAENSLFFLQTLLYYIARPDLYELVLEYRTKRQNDMRKIGVEIMYDMCKPDDRGISMTKELKSFRKSLKPRSRFNTVDIQTMMKRMSALKAKMKSKLPRTIDHGYTDSVMTSASMSDDSEWTDVDTDDEGDIDELDDGDSRGDTEAGRIANLPQISKTLDGAIKASGEECDGKESVRLPKIVPKRKVEVEIKTGRDGEDDSEVDTGDGKSTVGSSQSGFVEDLLGVVRIPGPVKPIYNFTHRSNEFLDLKINGKQTYNDDDVIACVRDVNKVTSGRSNDLDKANKNDADLDALSITQAKSLTTTAVKPVPMKFKVLRRKYRMESPGRRARRIVKRHKPPKPLPQIKPEMTDHSGLKSEMPDHSVHQSSNLAELAQIKRTHSIPKHLPQRVNFLPDIYDKYARKSVSTASTKVSTKTPTSRKSRKR
ncbi:uncharacterized protein LOC121406107 isoform X1 [Lytechinus variegatus]|uniref:uncharacterized protein LOC121406107 isoform X1 n=1 Tax=Lytechinus variegatus TaxID=7654 RepID=UPI001BB27BFF|nr:uncharacterized protein LOC121406107 isoform X1 [Lytechinus variegatus]